VGEKIAWQAATIAVLPSSCHTFYVALLFYFLASAHILPHIFKRLCARHVKTQYMVAQNKSSPNNINKSY